MKRIIIFILLVIVVACSDEKVVQKVTFSGETQGTYYAITYFDVKGRDLQPQVDSILKAFDQSVSLWVPSSIISRINANDSLVKPDTWFIDLFKLSTGVAEKTGGAFDYTVGPLVNAWGFGFKNRENMNQHIVDSLLHFVGYKNISFIDGRILKKDPRMQLDFNAIAQGYAVDVLGKFLESERIMNYLIDIGGEVKGMGVKSGGENWLVGIENPSFDSLAERTLNTRSRIRDKALATSGNYRKYYEKDGVRYSHTIDPKTGYPVQHNLSSVSVLAGDCAIADAFATAFMVMGLEKSKEYLTLNPGLEAYFIYSTPDGQYKTFATKGFEKILVKE